MQARILLFLALFSLSSLSFSQNEKGEKFLKTMKTYYITHPKDIVNQTINIINGGLWDEGYFEMRFKAFYSVLFVANPAIKAEFQKKVSKIKSSEFSDLFEQLFNTTVEDVYANAPETPDVNEMLCYSYYANGDTKYLNQLLEKAKDNEERVDLMKFMIGANALWWLANTRDEDILIQQYLETLPNNNYAVIALKSRAYDLKNQQLVVLEDQKKKKIWK